MNNDPLTLLNLEEDAETARGRRGPCWMIALGTLAGFTGGGIAIAIMLPRHESDWFGARFILTSGAGLILGTLSCVVFAALSFARSERHCIWAILFAVPSLALLLTTASAMLSGPIGQMQAKHEAARVAECQEQLRRDPGIGLREKWYVFAPGADSTHWGALYRSFSDPTVHYSTEELQQFYDASPVLRQYLFRSTGCTPQFLAAHFPAAFKNDVNFNSITLESMITNPNCPTELVEKVAASQLLGDVVDTAKRELKKRRPPGS